MEIREVDPTPGSAFVNVGALQDVTINDVHEIEEVIADTGYMLNSLSRGRKVSGVANLLQTSKDEIDLLTGAVSRAHAIRYSGLASPTLHQTYVFPVVRVAPSVTMGFKPGIRVLPVLFNALRQAELTYTVPEYYMMERAGEILVPGLQLWVAAREYLNGETAKILDVSGWERHGDVSTDYTAIWDTAASPYFLRLDGTNDSVNFGNVSGLNDDASGDFMVEAWLKFPVGGAEENVLTKKALTSDNSAGWTFHKGSDNTIRMKVASGSAQATGISVATITTTWKHAAATVDRNGNIQMYVNGAASGAGVSVAAIGTGSNSQNLYLGRDGTDFGQADVGDVRVYRWATGGLPSNIATVISNHYNAEKAYYGV